MRTKCEVRFLKAEGTGNDFLFIDARTDRSPSGSFLLSGQLVKRSELAKAICDRHFGVGADGLVFVESRDALLAWDFYNSDGSVAEMCGNATRCMGRWVERACEVSAAEFQTKRGLVKVSATAFDVVSRLDFVTAETKQIEFMTEGRSAHAYLVDTGVPHAVVLIDDISQARSAGAVIAALRFHPSAGSAGANVTFLEKPKGAGGLFKTVTFERGVEGFTLSCGTGVLAAAAVGLQMAERELGKAPLLTARVQTPGGELQVVFGPRFEGVELRGPARVICEGSFKFDLPHC